MQLFDTNRSTDGGRPSWLSRRSYIAPFEVSVLPGGMLHVSIFLPVKDTANGFIRFSTKRTAADFSVILEEFEQDPEGVVAILFEDHPFQPDVELRKAAKPAAPTGRKERVSI